MSRALTAAKLALFPVLVAQGLRVRRTALELPEAAGEREGEVLPPLHRQRSKRMIRLLVVGDSSAAGVGVAHQHQALATQVARTLAEELGQPVRWVLVARTGHSSIEALAQARTTEVPPADILLTVLGVNDVVRQIPSGRTASNLLALHAWAQHKAGVRYWLHSGLPPLQHFPLLPNPLRWMLGRQAAHLNRELHALLGDQQDRALCSIPAGLSGHRGGLMAADGFHPGERGYALWGDALGHFLARRWGRVERRRAPRA